MTGIKKNEIVLFSLLAALLAYGAMACSAIWYKGIPFADFVARFPAALLHPERFGSGEILPTFLYLGGLVWLAIFAGYILTRGNFLFGKEMGSARWGTAKEVNRHLQQESNVILSENIQMGLRMSVLDGHGRQLNTIVYGGSGAGKTFFYVLPNLLQANTSYVVVDPAGDLLRSTGSFFQKKGYCMKVLNLMEMEKSDAYNPFAYVKTQNDMQKLIDFFWSATEEQGVQKGEPFWDDAAKSLLLALAFYLWETNDVLNFRSLSAMLAYAEPEDDEVSALDGLFEELRAENPESVAVWLYESFCKGANKTKQSILQVLNARLFRTRTQEFEEMTAFDALHLEELYDDAAHPGILYLVIPTVNTTYNFLVSILYMQLFEGIVNRYLTHGACKSHLRVMMDEAANVALPRDFQKVPAVCRKYNFSIVMILQSMSQLKSMFQKEHDWEGVESNMDTEIYLGSTEQSTHEYFSKALEKRTIDYKTRGYSRGLHGNASENIQITGRELMTPDEIRSMSNKQCLVFVRDEPPVKDNKYNVTRHPNYKETAGGGAEPYAHTPDRRRRGHGTKEAFAAREIGWEEVTPLDERWEAVE